MNEVLFNLNYSIAALQAKMSDSNAQPHFNTPDVKDMMAVQKYRIMQMGVTKTEPSTLRKWSLDESDVIDLASSPPVKKREPSPIEDDDLSHRGQ